MAHKKAAGSTALGRDSAAQRLGPKKFSGELVLPGMVLVRQRGSKIRPGQNVKKGKDDTLFATTKGVVAYQTKKITRYTGHSKVAKFVSVLPKK